MPTTLFVWELGGGSGHLLEMQQVIDALRGAGHRLFAAVRDVARAGLVWGRAVTCLQAPCKLNPTPAEVRVPHTFAHILHNVGFADAGELAALVDAWRCIFHHSDSADPFHMRTCDHGPQLRALLASPTESRTYGFHRLPAQHPGGVNSRLFRVRHARLW